MFKNYFKTALRNFNRQRAYSMINVSGLALGLAVFLLAVLHTAFNLSFDTFHHEANHIYGIVQVIPSGNKGEQHTAIIPSPLLPAMVHEIGEIEEGTRFFQSGRTVLSRNGENFYEYELLFVDTNFLSFFNFKMSIGDPQIVLSNPYSIVLSKTSAIKYFGKENPVGKMLTINQQIDVTITGVIEDAPLNSSIHYDFLVSMETARSLYNWMDDWKENKQAAFVRLPSQEASIRIQAGLIHLMNKYFGNTPDAPKRLYLLPLLDFRSQSESLECSSYLYWNEPFVVSYFLLGMALILLLVVCINFMNMATARYATRAREVGLRKVVGAQRFQLIKQFLGESVFMAVLAFPIAIIFYQFIRPMYLSYIGHEMDLFIWNYPIVIITLFGFTILLGILTGSYPAFFLSRFKPANVLKGKMSSKSKGGRLRRILVVTQFTFAILLIVFAFAIKNQLNFLVQQDMGYTRDHIMAIPITDEAQTNLELMKKELVRHPDILSVSAADHVPINWWSPNQIIPQGMNENEKWTVQTYGIDYGFIELLDMKIIQGRSFLEEYSDSKSIILNQAIARQLQWENPLGKRIRFGELNGTVIGVAEDFLFNNAHWDIGPAILYLEQNNLRQMFIKLSSSPNSDILAFIREQWKNFAPDLPFQHTTLDQRFETAYSYIDEMSGVFSAIGVFAIIISCVGLVALASYTVERRKKEIGVRKILGAGVPSIIRLLLTEFALLICIANVVGWPLTYFLLKSFLAWGWTCTTPIGIDIFTFAAFLSLITMVTAVSYQTWKAAITNPVDTLKYE